jgi:hypothetical protein
MLYWPESNGDIDSVGYNHAVSLTRRALGDYISWVPPELSPGVSFFQAYYNIPYHPKPKKLKTSGLPLVVFSMYESSRLPETWVNFLNRHAKAVVVPSVFCLSVFRNSGVKVPVKLMSLGIDTNVIKPVPIRNNREDAYTYLWQGVAFDPRGRKGVDIVLEAFRRLKREKRISEKCRLILKYRPINKESMFRGRMDFSSGVVHVCQELTRDQLIDLYTEVDCCVNPTRGEGFGLIPLEQAAMGRPVIVTPWNIPYFDSRYFLGVKFNLAESPISWNHRFVQFNLNGFDFNWFGEMKSVKFWPKILKEMPDGRRIKPFPDRPVSFKEAIIGTVNNFLRKIQLKLKLHYVPGRKTIKLFQEFPGNDAEVWIDDLCDVMQWCFEHQDQARRMGWAAAEHVAREWSLERMKRDFERDVKPLLEGLKHE